MTGPSTTMAPRPLRSGRLPDGLVAMLGDGVAYRCAGIDQKGMARLLFDGAGRPPYPAFTRSGPGEPWMAVVRAADCERIVEVSHRATHQGREWLVSPILDGDELVTLSLVADPVTVVRVDFAVPTGYHESHRNEAFRFWQWRTLGFVPGPTTPADRPLPEIEYPGLRLGRFATVDGLTHQVAGEAVPGEPIVLLYRGTDRPHPEAEWDEHTAHWRRQVTDAQCARLVDVTGLAGYGGAEYQVSTAWPGGLVSIAPTGGGTEQQVPVTALYNYREVHRNLLYDRWRALRPPE